MIFPDINPSTYSRPKYSFEERLRKGDGSWQINQIHDVKPRMFRPAWEALTGAELLELEAHFDVDSANEFPFYDFSHLPWTLDAGVGDGTAGPYTLPAKNVVITAVKLDGTPTEDYGFLPGAGADGEDQIQFFNPVAADVVITVETSSSRRKYLCVYAGVPTFEAGWVEGGVHAASAELEGVAA